MSMRTKRSRVVVQRLVLAVVLGVGVIPGQQAGVTAKTLPTSVDVARSGTDRPVAQPTVGSHPVSGIDKALLARTPEPKADQVRGLSTNDPDADGGKSEILKPAVVATVPVRKPVELVAVTARRAFPDGTKIQVRARERSGWSAWTELEIDPDHGPDPTSEEGRRARPGSDPLMTVNADRIQIRVDTITGRAPRGIRLVTIDAPQGAADSQMQPKGPMTKSVRLAQLAGKPSIISRAQWGANESWRSRGPLYTSDIRVGFVHHTASTSNYSTAQAAAQVRAIYAYHTHSLGHSDIDYNFLVDRFGRLYEGRFGGIDRAVLGGHTAGFNEHSFAIVALGNFSTFKPSSPDMAAIKDAIARLTSWKLGLYGVNPAATVKVVSQGFPRAIRYPAGRTAKIPALSSHQTVNYTSCPGTFLQAQMSAIRSAAAAYSGLVLTAPTPGRSAVADSHTTLTFSSWADRAVTWTADILSPCSDTPVRSVTGSTAGAQGIDFSWDLADSSGSPVPPTTYSIRMTAIAADGSTVEPVSNSVLVRPAPGGAWGPCGNVSRVTGDSPQDSSVLWGKILAPSATTAVVTGVGSASALTAGLTAAPLAKSLAAPLLLTSADSLAPSVAADLRSRGLTHVLVVGGTDVVDESVVSAIAALGITVERIAGTTPAGTAAAVAARMPGGSAVLVAPDSAMANAIAGTALASALGAPVLLSAGASIPSETVTAAVGRTLTVSDGSILSDALLATTFPGTAWTRLAGADAPGAGTAVASAFAATVESAQLLSDDSLSWATGPVAAVSGMPVLFTSSPVLTQAVADLITSRPALRSVNTTLGSSAMDDAVLFATSRRLLGLPLAPTPVVTAAPQSVKYRIAPANAAPEPVRRGRTLKVTAKITQRVAGASSPVPAGTAFKLQFKAAGKKSYKTLASGTTTLGRATSRVKATKSGRWRIVVGGKASGSDQVKVRK